MGFEMAIGKRQLGRKYKERRDLASILSEKFQWMLAFNRVGLENFKVNEFQRGDMCRVEHHRGSLAGLPSFFPTQRTQAPAIARLETWEMVFRRWCAEIIADRLAEFQKFGGDLSADEMQAHILASGIATARAIETGQRILAARCQWGPQYVFRSAQSYFPFTCISDRCSGAIFNRTSQAT